MPLEKHGKAYLVLHDMEKCSTKNIKVKCQKKTENYTKCEHLKTRNGS